MVEPVTVGIAAAALLATKFGEEFAQRAGEGAWNAVQRLRSVIAAKFHGDNDTERAVAALEQTPTEQTRALVAARITAAAQQDPVFGNEIRRLVEVARQDEAVSGFVAKAFDHAKQVNFGGDNAGQINL
ncbi:hypothetical protein [Nocardia sp. NPDC049149]|uniref:hypothetical protein n=1 Tax=Nocardia sp. NPDC049149 TaxID=3364315 RepID=UPI00371832E9